MWLHFFLLFQSPVLIQLALNLYHFNFIYLDVRLTRSIDTEQANQANPGSAGQVPYY